MMSTYQEILQEEAAYLKETLVLLKNELYERTQALHDKKKNLISARKDMWEDTVHYTNDFDKLTEVNQHLSEVTSQTASYVNILKRMEKYKNALKSPYFGRIDITEDDSEYSEKIYIGLCNIMDSETNDIFVYDWRAPISSMFYRYQIGRASYMAPFGEITCNIMLKRQYKIQDSELKYFFDSSIRIGDEILQEVLSRNSSAKMRNIVETIQKEQDMIIRDNSNDLLIVQGVAGSGKTSVALHRIAFLLYEGMESSISSNNIIIISPNSIFSKYISSVLPELGEESAEEDTFDDILRKLLDNRIKTETRSMVLETLILSQDTQNKATRQQSIEFKGSRTFVQILDRLLQHYERHMIDFKDVYYDGQIIETRHQLKNSFLNNKIRAPMSKRLKRIENILLDKIHPLQRKRLEKIKKIVQRSDGHEFEIKPFSRLLSMKKEKVFIKWLHSFTKVDYLNLYKILFNDSKLFFKLSQGLKLPENIADIISYSKERLDGSYFDYEDCAPLLYLKLKIEGIDIFSEKRQVVIDEAQDYYPLQYEVFKLLFKDARYTVLGDINQSIEKNADMSLYDSITEILDKKNTIKLFLNKSYRSSYEISLFTQRLMNSKQEIIHFDRHESEPMVVFKESTEQIDQAIINYINNYLKQGYESVAVISKTQKQAEEIYSRLKSHVSIKLINSKDSEIEKGALCIPAYLAKGLEFDAVIVYNASSENFRSEFDRKLLYVSCTRALHRLTLYYTGQKSPFI